MLTRFFKWLTSWPVVRVLLLILLVLLLVGITVGLWFVNRHYHIETDLLSPFPRLHPYWLPLLFLLVLTGAGLGYWFFKLLTDPRTGEYPDIDDARSLHDAQGEVVQPYGIYDPKNDAAIGSERRYRVEFWPIGNRFRKGHRIRLDIIGVSAYHLPALPALNSVRVGGDQPSRLLLPVLPGSDLQAALGGGTTR